MQAHIVASDPITPHIPASASEPPPPHELDMSARRAIYAEAIKAGCKNSEASRRAGINPNTGVRWRRKMLRGDSDIPSKDVLVADLFKEYTRADTPYKANLAKRIFEAMGFAMRAQSDDTNRHPTRELRDLVITWWNERPAPHVRTDIDLEAAPTKAFSEGDIRQSYRSLDAAEPTRGVDPPAGARAEAFGATPPPPQNSENSALGERAVVTQGSVVLAATDSAPVK